MSGRQLEDAAMTWRFGQGLSSIEIVLQRNRENG